MAVAALAVMGSDVAANEATPAVKGETKLACPSTRIPPELTRLESAAEDIGDDVAQGRTGKARQLSFGASRDLDALASVIAPALVAAARMHLATTRTAIESRRPLDAQFAANELASDVVDMFSSYRPVVPVEVMRLDVLLRRAQLEGQANLPMRAESPLQQTQAIWTALRNHAPLAGTSAARRFDREIVAVHSAVAAGDAKALRRNAGVALEAVDALERVYQRTCRRPL